MRHWLLGMVFFMSATGWATADCMDTMQISPASQIATSFIYSNKYDVDVIVYWVDFAGREVEYTRLPPGDSYTQQTYQGHIWRIRNLEDASLLEQFVAKRSNKKSSIK